MNLVANVKAPNSQNISFLIYLEGKDANIKIHLMIINS